MEFANSLDSFIDKFGGWTEKYLFYNDTEELRYDPKDHVYFRVSGEDLERLDGVTTVVHVIDKSEALIPWGCKMMANKLIATTPTMTLPTGDKIVPQQAFADFEKLVTDAKKAHKEKLEEAANVGTIAHNWIEQYIKAVLAKDSDRQMWLLSKFPEDPRSANCVQAALDWMAKHNVRWIYTERKIYSRKYKYAGTMDGLAYVSSCNDPMCCASQFTNLLSVIDWKSSNYLYLEYLFQTAAYEQAYEEESGVEVKDRWIIRMGKDDGEFEPWHCTERDFAADWDGFNLCLDLVRRVAVVKARVKERTDTLKRERKALAKAEKEAALRVKCKSADKYKGVRKPTCGGGEGCETCRAKYAFAQAQKGEK